VTSAQRERVGPERSERVTLNGVAYAVSPRLAAMLARLVEGRAELDRLDRFSARFEVAGERVALYVTAPVRLGRTPQPSTGRHCTRESHASPGSHS
jgi:hypothetical protein